jgi:Icc-related predicted phosphoesterase
MIIDCISDLHGNYPRLEGGDLLIIAGDLTRTGERAEFEKFFSEWLVRADYKKKIFIAGNHDNALVGWNGYDSKFFQNVSYLCDSGTEFEYDDGTGLELEECGMHPGCAITTYKIWGSPWTKKFPGMNPNCMAFTVDTEEELAEKWKLIPDDIDILITHSPPFFSLDEVKGEWDEENDKFFIESVGSFSLEEAVTRIKPSLHVFGHIHENGGQILHLVHLDKSLTTQVNASHVNERYEPVNKPIRIEL